MPSLLMIDSGYSLLSTVITFKIARSHLDQCISCLIIVSHQSSFARNGLHCAPRRGLASTFKLIQHNTIGYHCIGSNLREKAKPIVTEPIVNGIKLAQLLNRSFQSINWHYYRNMIILWVYNLPLKANASIH
ncbi:hypothetical protein BLOT_012676 [Blomia tropicalis]|nr:hypothetical protein BLOT_012676 [Blomia tropicalis]